MNTFGKKIGKITHIKYKNKRLITVKSISSDCLEDVVVMLL